MPPMDPKKRQQLLRRSEALKLERSSFISQWMEITSHLMPWNGRYFRTDRNKSKRANNILDNTGIRALKTLAAGLMSGATSPARPWFRLAVANPELAAYQPVKLWLDAICAQMHQVYQKSNTYRTLQQIYEELGAFGTAGAIILPDFENVIHCYPLTAGEYCIATDAQGNVCTIYRDFEMQVSQMVKEFGFDNCSINVQNLYTQGILDAWIQVIHAIEPRTDRDITKVDNKNMAWASYYFEPASTEGKCLRESGFKRFPGIVPRWATSGGDIYGNSPGMEAIGDVKQLQHEQLRKANAIDFQTNPPKVLPLAAKNAETNFLPGGTSYFDSPNGPAVKSAFEVNLNLSYLLQDIQDVRTRVNKSFFTDVFMMLEGVTDPKMTATEVAARQEEKMLMMGPVLERLSNEALKPLVENTFIFMMQAGMIPPPPPEMQGQGLSIEFVGILAQAQRAIATNNVDRFVGAMGAVAQFKPEVLDNFNPDAWASSYSDMMGVDQRLIVPQDQVQAIRKQRAQAQAAQAQNAAMQQMSQTAKNLGGVPTGGAPNAASDMMNQYSGYGSPSPQEVG